MRRPPPPVPGTGSAPLASSRMPDRGGELSCPAPLDDPPPATQIARMTIPTPEYETLAKVEVLADLEQVVHDMMVAHEAKRILWFPSELLAPAPDTDPDHYVAELRRRAR